MKRVWLASAVAAAFWVSASAPALAQNPPGVRIYRIGAMSVPRAASDADTPAASALIAKHIEPASDALVKDIGAADTIDTSSGAEVAPAAAAAATATQAVEDAATKTLAAPPQAVADMPGAAPMAGSDDVSDVMLQALACSNGCAAAAAIPGMELVGSRRGGTLDQQRMAALFRDQLARTWTEEQQRAIVMLGYYSAAATLCGTALDADEVAQLVQANFAGEPGASVEQQRHLHDALTMHIGMAAGLAMGAHVENISAFCQEAANNERNFATPLLKDVPAALAPEADDNAMPMEASAPLAAR